MEARKITIVDTRGQKKYIINSTAETLGDLKADLDKAGVNYTDMAFIEGISKNEPKEDSALLPKDVKYTNRETGETKITNELVFFLTNQSKKIASGIEYADRKACYSAIKELNLQEAVKEAFGKNFTQVSTESLQEFLKENTSEEEPQEEPQTECPAHSALRMLLDLLYDKDVISYDNYSDLRYALDKEETKAKKEDKAPYSDSELDAMIAGIRL